MNIAITYAIWLNSVTSQGADHYVYEGSIYYTDSGIDMEKLFAQFEQSEFYKNSIEY